MLKVKDFDYDLWTTVEDGVKHYWAKVRETGEITEISHEVMVYLRSEEKRIYREIAMTRKKVLYFLSIFLMTMKKKAGSKIMGQA